MVSDIKRDIPKFGTVFTETKATYGENTQAKFQQLEALSFGPKA